MRELTYNDENGDLLLISYKAVEEGPPPRSRKELFALNRLMSKLSDIVEREEHDGGRYMVKMVPGEHNLTLEEDEWDLMRDSLEKWIRKCPRNLALTLQNAIEFTEQAVCQDK